MPRCSRSRCSRVWWFWLGLGMIAAAPLRAQTTWPPERERQLAAAVQRVMTRDNIPGLSAAGVVDHRVVWAAGFGKADLENDVPARPDTVYRTASIAKTFTAVAALRLVERGKLDLDTPVQKYVPEFPEKPWPITSRQLLGHLSGIRHYKGDEVNSTRMYPTLAEGLDIFKNDPLAHASGARYLYTTYGFNLLGVVVEKASGQGFRAYVKEQVVDMAGLTHTRVDDQAAIIPGRAAGYRKLPSGQLANSRLADTSHKIPGGGLVSTAPDLARFAIALQTGKLVKPDTLKLMSTPQRLKSGEPTQYGMGLGVGNWKGSPVISHSGGQQRVSTLLWMVPERKLAVALMCNLEGARLAPLALELAEILTTP